MCRVEIKRVHAARVKKAVAKEKDLDVVFKRANICDPCTLTTSEEISDKAGYLIITFRLKQQFGITDMVRV